jgi:hypothetical protein
MRTMICRAAAALHTSLEKRFPARHLETEGPLVLAAIEAENEVLEPRMIGMFEAPGAELLDDGTMLIRPSPHPGTAEWTPFNDDGGLRTELFDEGWAIVGSVKEE